MKKRKKIVFWIVIIASATFGLIWGLSGPSGSFSKTTRELSMSCTLDMYTKFHIHPHLTIMIDGAKQTIPANVGVAFGCMHPLHTHDDTGEIHIESPEKRGFTLGDFFAVWGKQFDKNRILDSQSDAAHEVALTINGAPSEQFEKLVLNDKDQIVIEYRKK